MPVCKANSLFEAKLTRYKQMHADNGILIIATCMLVSHTVVSLQIMIKQDFVSHVMLACPDTACSDSHILGFTFSAV